MRAAASVAVAVTILLALPLRAQVVEWARCYDGPGRDWDASHAVAVDDSGHVYVTGASRGIGTDFDYATVKYAPNGVD